MTISGFTIVRNAQILDYPFTESVESVLPFCEEFVINCGDSEDNTLDLCESLQKKHSKIKLLRSQWEKKNQSGGLQLKQQTDYALSQCTQPWCFYIQADEVFLESDFKKLRQAQLEAEKRPEIDGILLQYLHFYGNYHYQIEGRNWYRKEVRLFKNFRQIEAFRDAQGFRREGQRLSVLETSARIFHYGYVRSPVSFSKKQKEMDRWWGKESTSPQHLPTHIHHFGLRKYNDPHPQSMTEKVASSPPFDPTDYPRKLDKQELKNILTLLWETMVPVRIGEFRNYVVRKSKIEPGRY